MQLLIVTESLQLKATTYVNCTLHFENLHRLEVTLFLSNVVNTITRVRTYEMMEVYPESNYVPNFSYDMDFINSLIDDLPNIQYITEDNQSQIINYQPELESLYTSDSSIEIKQEDDKYSIQASIQQNMKLQDTIKTKMTCPVCNEGDAGCHKHYGGKACISCRAFFRRSVQNDAYKDFACVNSENGTNLSCDINSKSWSSCRYCRFQQCLGSGLKVSLVLTKSQRDLRQTKRTNKPNSPKKTLVKKAIYATINGNSLSNTSFTKAEIMKMSSMCDQFMWKHYAKELPHFMVKNNDTLDTLLKLSYKKNAYVTSQDVTAKLAHGNWWKQIFKQFASANYSDYNEISTSDLEILHNYNMPIVYFLNSALTVGNKIVPSPMKEMLGSLYQRQQYLAQYLPHTPSDQDIRNLLLNQHSSEENHDNAITLMAIRALKQKIEITASPKPVEYSQVYPPEMWQDYEAKKWENMLKKNIHDVAEWPTFKTLENSETSEREMETNQESTINTTTKRLTTTDFEVDYLLLHLISLVTLYSSDNCKGIQNKAAVERLQTRYLNALSKYLQFRYPNDATTRLARGMDVISKARESCEILQLIISWLTPL